ncbi:MAG: bifunctional hydroxymethylpyrimidine kinase/phosphomethylpyrimidine kinase [Bacillota bacterium]|nr:bifunctional hydroxymethylpyrimidine kinase/phosphomethylpyrimidine kinase [Bacillota bacterium]
MFRPTGPAGESGQPACHPPGEAGPDHSLRLPSALTIAGSDSGGGAGIQADLKTFAALGVWGASALTAVTAQNTRAVLEFLPLPPPLVVRQIEAVWDDLDIRAVKTGMLATAAIIEAVADALSARGVGRPGAPPLVVDPVMVSATGCDLLEPGAVQALRERLLPLATLVTPNLPEAERLAGLAINSHSELEEAARRILALGPRAVLIKGGHLKEKRQRPAAGPLQAVGIKLSPPAEEAVDLLYDGKSFRDLRAPRVAVPDVHGTGCTLSAAWAAYLARGLSLPEAAVAAKEFISAAIRQAVTVGGGLPAANQFPGGPYRPAGT